MYLIFEYDTFGANIFHRRDSIASCNGCLIEFNVDFHSTKQMCINLLTLDVCSILGSVSILDYG